MVEIYIYVLIFVFYSDFSSFCLSAGVSSKDFFGLSLLEEFFLVTVYENFNCGLVSTLRLQICPFLLLSDL